MTVTVTVAPLSLDVHDPRDRRVPQHGEVCVDHLVCGGKVQPDLEQLCGVVAITVEQREHFTVHDAAAGRHPLHITPTEPGGRAERVGVVDEALACVCDRFEAAMRMRREAGNDLSVVHAPAVSWLEIGAELPAGKRRHRPKSLVPRWIRVEVVNTEQKWIDRRPLEPQGHGLQNGRTHEVSLATHEDAIVLPHTF